MVVHLPTPKVLTPSRSSSCSSSVQRCTCFRVAFERKCVCAGRLATFFLLPRSSSSSSSSSSSPRSCRFLSTRHLSLRSTGVRALWKVCEECRIRTQDVPYCSTPFRSASHSASDQNVRFPRRSPSTAENLGFGTRRSVCAHTRPAANFFRGLRASTDGFFSRCAGDALLAGEETRGFATPPRTATADAAAASLADIDLRASVLRAGLATAAVFCGWAAGLAPAAVFCGCAGAAVFSFAGEFGFGAAAFAFFGDFGFGPAGGVFVRETGRSFEVSPLTLSARVVFRFKGTGALAIAVRALPPDVEFLFVATASGEGAPFLEVDILFLGIAGSGAAFPPVLFGAPLEEAPVAAATFFAGATVFAGAFVATAVTFFAGLVLFAGASLAVLPAFPAIFFASATFRGTGCFAMPALRAACCFGAFFLPAAFADICFLGGIL
eukprot:2100797-Rhodomonas_salina.1